MIFFYYETLPSDILINSNDRENLETERIPLISFPPSSVRPLLPSFVFSGGAVAGAVLVTCSQY